MSDQADELVDETTIAKRLLHCSFCGKAQTDVKKLIAGPGVFICNQCVDLCTSIMAAEAGTPEPSQMLTIATMPIEQLLKMLSGYNRTFEAVGEGMQNLVDVMREREVSWATIGEALGVSRQAAWKRFS